MLSFQTPDGVERTFVCNGRSNRKNRDRPDPYDRFVDEAIGESINLALPDVMRFPGVLPVNIESVLTIHYDEKDIPKKVVFESCGYRSEVRVKIPAVFHNPSYDKRPLSEVLQDAPVIAAQEEAMSRMVSQGIPVKTVVFVVERDKKTGKAWLVSAISPVSELKFSAEVQY